MTVDAILNAYQQRAITAEEALGALQQHGLYADALMKAICSAYFMNVEKPHG